MVARTFEIFEELVRDHLLLDVVVITVATFLMVAAMAVDLLFGIRKAKQLGQARTSTGLKKTCDKARKYFSPYMCLVCIDVLTCIVVPLPVFTMLWAAYCIYCEFTSVREKAWKKAELRKAERTMSVIIENKDDIAKLVAELLMRQNEEKK
jgi:hypothetical protein